jgi:predicted phosphodiesterase
MNIAVLSCIHGNLEALEAVLRDIDQQSVDQIYSLGDLVGYGPYPNEVVARIRELGIPTCQGCWDEDIVDGLNACDCSYPSLLAETRGRLAHEWTNQAVTPEIRDYLAELPLTLQQDNLCFVHGSPHSQHEYLLPDTSAFIALERVLATGADTLFCGHTHVPYVRNLENSSLTLKVVAPSNQPPIDSPTRDARLRCSFGAAARTGQASTHPLCHPCTHSQAHHQRGFRRRTPPRSPQRHLRPL